MPRYALSWTACQSSRPSTPRAKLPLPPSWPVSVAAVAYPERTGPLKPLGFPPTHPPPPVPRTRPVQPVRGRGGEHRDPAPGGGVRHGRRGGAGPVRGVELDRIDGRVRERDLGQVLVGDHRRAVRDGRPGRGLADLGTSDGGRESD